MLWCCPWIPSSIWMESLMCIDSAWQSIILAGDTHSMYHHARAHIHIHCSHVIYGGLGLGKTIGKNRKSRIDGQPGSYIIACMHACVRACVPACLRACVPVCVCVYDDDDDDDEFILGISALVVVKAEWLSTYSITHIGNTYAMYASEHLTGNQLPTRNAIVSNFPSFPISYPLQPHKFLPIIFIIFSANHDISQT